MPIEIRSMEARDWSRVASLIFTSTNAWYEAHARPPIFRGDSGVAEVFCRVYEALDPGCCALACEDDRILGSCFYHPRSTHVSLGIMNVHPDAFGRGVASRLLRVVTEFAEQRGLPVRLVSSAVNLDSFSLYNRAGFVPYAVFQDMILDVPESGLPSRPAGMDAVRDATLDDLEAIVALERDVLRIERAQDYRYFMTEGSDIFRVSVLYDGSTLAGFLASVHDPGSHMIGPGAMRSDDAALALIAFELARDPGHSPVAVIPADRPALTQALYALGGRNCELHLAQVLGEAHAPAGVFLPSFLPETA